MQPAETVRIEKGGQGKARRRGGARAAIPFPARFGFRSGLCLALAVVAFVLVAPVPCAASGKNGHFTITAAGDIMMGTTYPTEELPPGDGRRLLLGVRDVLGGSDITFGNLEAPFIEEGTARKCGEGLTGGNDCYEFRMPPRYAAHLAAAGFNVVSVANNHINDFGTEGFTRTLKTLESVHIQAAGGRKVARFHIRGKKIAVAGFSFSAFPSSSSILDAKKSTEFIRGLKKQNDIVIVSFHGGAEGRKALHVSDAAEEYAGEMRGNVVRFSRMAIDAGADLVLGHGPHVLRALEVYKGKLIAYSLGSFLVYRKFNVDGPAGLSMLLKVTIDGRTGKLVSGKVVPLVLGGAGIPSIDKGRASIRLVKELTEKDFGRPSLVIEEDGRVYPSGSMPASPRVRSLLDYLRKVFSPFSSRP
jgi:poly-gamma-glutamate capsule biosynthesis protein CapA/YwtB (metallophosphatase superfamily)